MDTVPPPIAPHAPLPRHYAESAQRDRFVRALFDQGAPSYDRINAIFSFGTVRCVENQLEPSSPFSSPV